MKKYIILGIGIGIILTNFFYSFMPKESVDVNKLVETEVQKRIKKIEEMKEVENVFKEAVKEDEKTAEKEEVPVEKEEIKFYSKDNDPNAVYYIYIDRLKQKKDVIRVKESVEEFIDIEILSGKNYTYIFSEYPYTVDNSDDIIKILNEKYKIKAIKIKEKQRNELIKKMSVKKTAKIKRVKKETVSKNEVLSIKEEPAKETAVPKE